jgi:hypothetical protein
MGSFLVSVCGTSSSSMSGYSYLEGAQLLCSQPWLHRAHVPRELWVGLSEIERFELRRAVQGCSAIHAYACGWEASIVTGANARGVGGGIYKVPAIWTMCGGE